MRARKLLLGIAAVISGTAAGVLAAGAVSAAQGPVDIASASNPILIPQSEVNQAWASAVENSKLILPDGTNFPKIAPWIFNTDDAGEHTFYEVGLFDTVAAQYWRCSWLKAELSGNAQRINDWPVDGEKVTATFAGKLGAEAGAEYEAYRNAIESEAIETGGSASAIEYAETCVLLTGEEN